jgi:hypothetical protein
MRIIIPFIFLCNYSLIAQKHDPISSLDVYYGYRPQIQNFYNQLSTLNNINFSKPLKMIGIGETGEFVISRNGKMTGHVIYDQIIPQVIYVQDTLKAKITGFVFSFAYGAAITTRSEKFALYYYSGFNTGRLRVYGNDLLKQKNPFFSPKVGIQPKIKMGKMALILILEYEYDLSRTTWRRTVSSKGNKTSLASFRQTGVTAQLGVGYVIE